MTVVDFNFPGIFEKSVLSKAVVNILEKAHAEDRLSKLNFEDFGYNLEFYQARMAAEPSRTTS